MVYGLWFTVYGLRFIVHGSWLDFNLWFMMLEVYIRFEKLWFMFLTKGQRCAAAVEG